MTPGGLHTRPFSYRDGYKQPALLHRLSAAYVHLLKLLPPVQQVGGEIAERATVRGDLIALLL